MTLAELDEHEVGVLAHLGERVRAHAQQHLLVRLAGRVDAEVRARGRGGSSTRSVSHVFAVIVER